MLAAITSLFWGEEEEVVAVDDHCVPEDFPCNGQEWIFVGTGNGNVDVDKSSDISSDEESETDEEGVAENEFEADMLGMEITEKACPSPVSSRVRKLKSQRREWIQRSKRMKPSQSKLFQRRNKVHLRQHGARSSKKLGRMSGKHTAVVCKRAS